MIDELLQLGLQAICRHPMYSCEVHTYQLVLAQFATLSFQTLAVDAVPAPALHERSQQDVCKTASRHALQPFLYDKKPDFRERHRNLTSPCPAPEESTLGSAILRAQMLH